MQKVWLLRFSIQRHYNFHKKVEVKIKMESCIGKLTLQNCFFSLKELKKFDPNNMIKIKKSRIRFNRRELNKHKN